MTYRRGLGVLHLAFGAFLLFDIVWQIADQTAAGTFEPEHYFFYFTNLTTILSGIMLVLTGGSMVSRARDAHLLTACAWAIVPCSAVTGVVYNVTLRGDTPFGADWVSDVNHVIAPIAIVADWFVLRLFDPGRARLAWRAIGVALLFPAAWIIETTLRILVGDGFIPYPFLDPDGPGGLPELLAYVLGIFVFMILSSFAGIAVTRVGRGRTAR